MEITNLTLAYHLLELRPLLEGVFVNSVQEVSKEIFKFRLHTSEGTKNLIANQAGLYISRYKIPAKQNATGFGAFLKKHLANKKIVSITQHNFDRVAVIEFSDYFLIFEFFRDSNIILADKDYLIVNCLKRQEWKDRSLKKGSAYRFPESRGANPAEITATQLVAAFRESEKDIARAFIGSINIAPVLAEEILHKLKIDKNQEAKGLKEGEIKKIHSMLKKFYSKVSKANLKPVKTKNLLLPFSLGSLQGQEEIASLNEAMDDLYSKGFIEKESAEKAGAKGKDIARLKHSLGQQLDAKKKFELQIEGGKKKAELIYTYFNELEELAGAVKIAGAKGLNKKEIMYKLELAAKKGSKSAALLKEYDPKAKEITVELD